MITFILNIKDPTSLKSATVFITHVMNTSTKTQYVFSTAFILLNTTKCIYFITSNNANF